MISRKTISLLILVSFFFGCSGLEPQQSQTGVADLNLGFEIPYYDNKPWGWYAGGAGDKTELEGYIGEITPNFVHSGKYSLHLKFVFGNGFGIGSTSMDVKLVRGKQIRYSGWIKTKNVSDFAGLWWRVDGPNNQTLAFNNMADSLVNGTRDWQQFSFELPVAQSATNIAFGVLMSGTGESWFDDLAIDTNGVRFMGEK